jgi:very-short-patch-repair endonuclease
VGPQRRGYDVNRGPHSEGRREGRRVRAEARARDGALAALASRQHGVVSGRQLAELGFTADAIRRRLEARRLHRLHRGVYAVGHRGITPRGHYLAAVVACGPHALLSHHHAAAIHGLLRAAPSAPIHVTVPRGVKPKPGISIHRTRSLHPDDRITVDAIPTTSIARTIVDLADVLTDRRLAAVVNEAEVLRRFDLNAIEATQARLPGRTGRHRLARVLAAHTEPLGYSLTEAERRLLELCERHGLPRPQRVFAAGYELDFYWADAWLAVEVDGGAYHRTRRAFLEDRRRDRRLAAEGIQVARVPWRDLTEAAADLAAELRAIREARRLTPQPLSQSVRT